MIHVNNEVGRLERVLVHRPGAEVVRMTQFELEPLLFDDILSVDLAGQEHDLLQQILAAQGASVHDITDVLVTGIDRAESTAVGNLCAHVCERAAVPELAPVLAEWPAEQLAAGLIEGVAWSDVPEAPVTLARLRDRMDGGMVRFALPPVPNLMFMRDPCVSLFNSVLIGRMATEARARESILVHFAMQFGLDAPAPLLFDHHDWERHPSLRAIEGGDILVLSKHQVMVGCSERTRPETLQRVTEDILFPAFPDLERVHAVIMPKLRSVMHLDTILTQVDRELFLGHAPMVNDADALPVVELTRAHSPRVLTGQSVADVLKRDLGAGVQVVPCGGEDPLHQMREQWTDGANAVCLGPGKIVLYDRNVRTAQTLIEQHGFEQVRLSTFMGQEERQQRLDAVRMAERVVYSFGGGELSRARGGGRCLTMPLVRAAL